VGAAALAGTCAAVRSARRRRTSAATASSRRESVGAAVAVLPLFTTPPGIEGMAGTPALGIAAPA
jgi:hypothetical protein